jgi:hypothetical protein
MGDHFGRVKLGEISFVYSMKIMVGVSDGNFGQRIKMIKVNNWVVKKFFFFLFTAQN